MQHPVEAVAETEQEEDFERENKFTKSTSLHLIAFNSFLCVKFLKRRFTFYIQLAFLPMVRPGFPQAYF